MSSKPICYWITQAPTSELQAQVLKLTTDLTRQRDRYGYHTTADVLEQFVPRILQAGNRALLVGLVLAFMLTHPDFYQELKNAEPDPARFEAAAEYLFTRFFALMSAREQHLSALAYDAGWFIVSRHDPYGQAHRRSGALVPKPFPTRKRMHLDIPASPPTSQKSAPTPPSGS